MPDSKLVEVPVLLLSYEGKRVIQSPGIWGVFNLCKLLITDMQQHLPDGYLWPGNKACCLQIISLCGAWEAWTPESDPVPARE